MEPSSSELATDLAAYLAADSIAVDYLVSAYSLEVESLVETLFVRVSPLSSHSIPSRYPVSLIFLAGQETRRKLTGALFELAYVPSDRIKSFVVRKGEERKN